MDDEQPKLAITTFVLAAIVALINLIVPFTLTLIESFEHPTNQPLEFYLDE